MVYHFACLRMVLLIATQFKWPMSRKDLKNIFLHTQVKNGPILSKTDQFQLKVPLFFCLRLLVKKSSKFLKVSTIFVWCLNLLKCPMHKTILPYVLAHIPKNNPL